MSISKEERQHIKDLKAKCHMAPLRRAYDKVGRNAPCPCGSGKKWKKCCANSTEPITSEEARKLYAIK
jgi:uncharacterized protein YecA (UPF0149 family)